MILIDISGPGAAVRKQTALTCGMVGARVRFRFDGTWDGLAKTAVFRAGDVTRDVLLEEDSAAIPHEVLTLPGLPLQIGVYGTNADGTLVIPTLWARTAPILPGADPSGDPSTDPTLPVWAQLQVYAEASGEHPGCFYRTVDGVQEWLNPPMEVGVEYRTTQRYMGKAVYTKLVDFGALPNTNTAGVDCGLSDVDVIHIGGRIISGTGSIHCIPAASANTVLAYFYYNMSTNRLMARSTADNSSWSAEVIIKYIKE